jgi:hypothetical protein
MKVICFIRKNSMTINEMQEIYEIVDANNAKNVLRFGTKSTITDILGTNQWNTNDTVLFENNTYQLENN